MAYLLQGFIHDLGLGGCQTDNGSVVVTSLVGGGGELYDQAVIEYNLTIINLYPIIVYITFF